MEQITGVQWEKSNKGWTRDLIPSHTGLPGLAMTFAGKKQTKNEKHQRTQLPGVRCPQKPVLFRVPLGRTCKCREPFEDTDKDGALSPPAGSGPEEVWTVL